jgi:hypothetical protein
MFAVGSSYTFGVVNKILNTNTLHTADNVLARLDA